MSRDKVVSKASTNMPAGASAPAAASFGVRQLPFVLLLLVCCTFAAGRMRESSDTWVSIAAGRHVLSDGIGGEDPFSFTTSGREWINQNWAAHVVIAWAYDNLGGNALLFMRWCLLLAAFGVAAGVGYVRTGRWIWPLLLAAGGVLLCQAYAELRADLFALVLLGLLLLLLEITRDRPRIIWLVPPLITLWANTHGSFPLGLLLLLWTGGVSVIGARGDRSSARRLAKRYGVVVGLSVIGAALITPYPITNLVHPLIVTAGDPVWQQVNEWRPIWRKDIVHPPIGPVVGVLTAIAMCGLAYATFRLLPLSADREGQPQRKRMSVREWSDVALVLLLMLAAVRSRRFVMQLMIISLPVLSVWIRHVSARLERLPGWRELLGSRLVPLTGWLVTLMAVGVLGGKLWRAYVQPSPFLNTSGTFDRSLVTNIYPRDALSFLARNEIGGRLFNEWEWGGYILANVPGAKVFIDGRAQSVYDPQTVDDYNAILHAPAENTLQAIKFILDKYEFQILLIDVNKHWPLFRDVWRSRRYQLICLTPAGGVFVNLGLKDGRELMRRFLKGELQYPSPAIKLLTQGALAIANPDQPVMEDGLSKILESMKTRPSPISLRMASAAWIVLDRRQEAITDLRNRIDQLTRRTMQNIYPGISEDMDALVTAHEMLADLYKDAGLPGEADKQLSAAGEVSENKYLMFEYYAPQL